MLTEPQRAVLTRAEGILHLMQTNPDIYSGVNSPKQNQKCTQEKRNPFKVARNMKLLTMRSKPQQYCLLKQNISSLP